MANLANPDRTILESFPLESTPEVFSPDDLRLIRAMCLNANPWYPDKAMFTSWEIIYNKAGRMLESHERRSDAL